MKGTVTIVAIGFCAVSVLAFPPRAAAGDIGWNPFLNIPICSLCGPQTPLTLEQADTSNTFFTESDGLTGPPVFIDPPGLADGGGGSTFTGGPRPTAPGGVVPSFLGSGPGAGGFGGGVSGGPGGGGSNGSGGNDDGVPYGLTVNNPPGPGGDGPGGPHNDVIFSLGDDSGPQNLSDTSGDTSGDQAGETLVPEPMSLLLLGSGLSAAAFRRRRQKA